MTQLEWIVSPLVSLLRCVLPKWLFDELFMLYSIAFHPVSGDTHQERLTSFYQAQASGYDAFRQRLLQGRELMVQEATSRASGGIWVDMGGGTGANLEMAGDAAVMSFAKVYIVDLCIPLLEVARKRCAERGWHNVECVEGDAATWVPPEGRSKVDLLTFSYSLTMIPDWFAALTHAKELLAADGNIAIVDFYVSRKYVEGGMARHSYVQRALWPFYFAHDDVRLSADHLPFITKAFSTLELHEREAPLPYLGVVLPRVPYMSSSGGRTDTVDALRVRACGGGTWAPALPSRPQARHRGGARRAAACSE
eukprot:CAMPEP_0183336142 /NCGR_PEP_ID=MMETSP0164_2-20130417/4214_1 /TAXON_ID=221442 /ORGANISM="Coccolithus pelagicus ssp braarudi, Strain PLY182g" /LENGTH=308 /DNA_ID=CAMNT_0025505613 /DNA_START=6 /DNA_END=930 /DNA_ORIENTATION=+